MLVPLLPSAGLRGKIHLNLKKNGYIDINFNLVFIVRSPDLSPVNFFLWNLLKRKVYAKEPENVEEVIVRLHTAVAMVDAEILLYIRNEVVRRAHACLAMNGGHFEQIPFKQIGLF